MQIEKLNYYRTKDGATFPRYEDAEHHQLELMGAEMGAVDMEVNADFSAFGFKNPNPKYGGCLSTRAICSLRSVGISFIRDLVGMGYGKCDLLKISTVGKKTLTEICELADTLKIEIGGITIK